jgi:hypothetical protein
MMKLERFKPIFVALAVLGIVVLIGSFAVSSLITQGAVLVQRIEPNEAASLFGDSSSPGTSIGSPQIMVIRDEKAFLEGQGENGARFVNDNYLRQNNIYPLQVKTVEFFRNVTAFVAGLGTLLMVGLLAWTRRSAGPSKTRAV